MAETIEQDPDALISALLNQQAVALPPEPKPSLMNEAADLGMWFLGSAIRLIQYASITVEALAEYKDKGADHLKPDNWSATDVNSMAQLLVMFTRHLNVKFLEGQKEQAAALVYGQTAVSLWGAFEVFVNDLLLMVVSREPRRIANVPKGIKVSLSEFYCWDDDKRTEEIIRLVADALSGNLKPGLGKFEPLLDAFGLGGGTSDLVKRTILEFSAMRNCIVHRKGIVDARFRKACGTSILQIGDRINLTSDHIQRYLYAAAQYSSTILERLEQQCEPEREADFGSTTWLSMLEGVQQA